MRAEWIKYYDETTTTKPAMISYLFLTKSKNFVNIPSSCSLITFSCPYQKFIYLVLWSVGLNLVPVFPLGCLCFYSWVVSSFYILDISSLSDIWIVNIFFQSLPCLFILIMISFDDILNFLKILFIRFFSYGFSCLCLV